MTATAPGEEGLLALAEEFLRDGGARDRALELDRARDVRLPALHDALESFRRTVLDLGGVCEKFATALPIFGFRNDDERLFLERLARATARIQDVDLAGVLRNLLQNGETIDDEERIQRLLAFCDFIADLDARGAESDPRLGVGPGANVLTFLWHVLSSAREPVFLFESNKAVKAVIEGGGLGQDPRLSGRDLEGRFRAFYAVARGLQDGLRAAPHPMRLGWAIEHALEWIYRRTSSLPQGRADDPGASGLWKPGPRGEPVRHASSRPPLAKVLVEASSRAFGPHDEGLRAPPPPPPAVGPSPAPKSIVIERPAGATPSSSMPRIEPGKTKALAKIEPAPLMVPPPPQPPVAPEKPRTNRFMTVGKGKVIVGDTGSGASAAPPIETSKAPEPPKPPEPPKGPEPPKKVEAVRIEVKKAEPAKVEAPEVEPAKPAPKIEVAKSTTQPLAPRRAPDPEKGKLLDQAVRELEGEIDTAERQPKEDPHPGGDVPWWRGDRLARDLGLEPALVEAILSAIATRGRALLTGPPGTGKTWLSRRLALHLAAREERALFLRVHPELGYDELVETRPAPGGAPRPGALKELIDRARRDREGHYVFVLDEAERGDAPRALGELLGAIAERGAEVALARSRERIAIPRNLHAIVTARELPPGSPLLGRFPVFELAPDPQALRRFFAERRPAMEWTADLLREANARLDAKRLPARARIGHGLLMDPELDPERLEAIWRREVLPWIVAQGADPAELDLASLRRGR